MTSKAFKPKNLFVCVIFSTSDVCNTFTRRFLILFWFFANNIKCLQSIFKVGVLQ